MKVRRVISADRYTWAKGNAKILNSSTGDSLLDSTGMTEYQYTIALMVFLVAYSVFEAPSNLAMKVFKPNR